MAPSGRTAGDGVAGEPAGLDDGVPLFPAAAAGAPELPAVDSGPAVDVGTVMDGSAETIVICDRFSDEVATDPCPATAEVQAARSPVPRATAMNRLDDLISRK